MSFLVQENGVPFMNIKLTDEGRKLLSLGQLTFDSVVISDSEMNYYFDPSYSYDLSRNRIFAPKDVNPDFGSINLDGTSSISLVGQNIGSAKETITSSTQYYGFFTGDTNNWLFDLSLTSNGSGYSKIDYSVYTPDGTNTITIMPGYYHPSPGEYAYITWPPIQSNSIPYSGNHNLLSSSSFVGMWYRVINVSGDDIVLDRNVPNFGATVPTSQGTKVYFYPNNAIDSSYSPNYYTESKAFNLNIVRTNSVIGTTMSMSGYSSYGSVEYNGTKHFLGFTDVYREIGIIHYTNKYSGNTNAEYWVDNSISLTIPNIMWHKTSASPGQAAIQGITLIDSDTSIYDSLAKTTYKNLKDGNSSNSNIVGRVYHKLQIIVITDAELLMALTYKSNRNYTLPSLSLSLDDSPKYPLTTNDVDGLCKLNKTYFVTYITESKQNDFSSSYGLSKTLHCGYISKINGDTWDGKPQYLNASFGGSNPFMRNMYGLTGGTKTGGAAPFVAGTGWNANSVKILVKETNTSDNYNIDTVPSDGWVACSGNGTYTGETGDKTVDPLNLFSYTFIISQQDYNSGTTYSIDPDNNNLKFGDETFFFGNLKFGKAATIFKTVISIYAKNDNFNTSQNTSFGHIINDDVYITGFGILNSNNVLVAVGKPSYPIKKNSSRYLTFQLELDF